MDRVEKGVRGWRVEKDCLSDEMTKTYQELHVVWHVAAKCYAMESETTGDGHDILYVRMMALLRQQKVYPKNVKIPVFTSVKQEKRYSPGNCWKFNVSSSNETANFPDMD